MRLVPGATIEAVMPRPIALVTGGTAGIGFGAARALAASHDLALGFAADDARATDAATTLREVAPESRIATFRQPLAGPDDAADLLEAVRTELGPPTVLVHAAGRIDDVLFLSSALERHLARIQEHLVVAMALAHGALDAMYRARFGRIVLIGSISAHHVKRGQCGYSAAKAGLEGFARALAIEVAHRGVTVNVVAPGLIETGMTTDVLARLRQGGRLRRHVPAGRAGRADEVGGMIAYLCSEAAAYVTGSILRIDGGRSLGEATP